MMSFDITKIRLPCLGGRLERRESNHLVQAHLSKREQSQQLCKRLLV